MPTPTHYQSSLEPIDAIREWELNFNLGNVIKYVFRAGKKGPAEDDLRKAISYLTHELNYLTRSTDEDGERVSPEIQCSELLVEAAERYAERFDSGGVPGVLSRGLQDAASQRCGTT